MKINRNLLELFVIALATEAVLGAIGLAILWMIK